MQLWTNGEAPLTSRPSMGLDWSLHSTTRLHCREPADLYVQDQSKPGYVISYSTSSVSIRPGIGYPDGYSGCVSNDLTHSEKVISSVIHIQSF